MAAWLLLALSGAGLAGSAAAFHPVNAQMYICNASEPWLSRQRWAFTAPGPITLASSGEALQLQLPSPSLATTCPKDLHSSCWNLIVGPVSSALQFTRNAASGQLVVSSAGTVHGLCVATSNAGTVSHSNGFLANVFLTECDDAAAKASTWEVSGGTVRSLDQCLDVGSAGSSGDLGFSLKLLPAAVPEQQAFHSKTLVSWGGTVIQDPESSKYHMFAAVFGGGKGLDSWTSNSEIMHLLADSPAGPFKPTKEGPKSDGIIISAEAHNPTIIRASDGTYLLFSIGTTGQQFCCCPINFCFHFLICVAHCDKTVETHETFVDFACEFV